jgi:hypothetical protein
MRPIDEGSSLQPAGAVAALSLQALAHETIPIEAVLLSKLSFAGSSTLLFRGAPGWRQLPLKFGVSRCG